MNGSEKIGKALRVYRNWTEGEVNAAHIYKGWHLASGRHGWIVRPFGKVEFFLAQTIKDSLNNLEAQAID